MENPKPQLSSKEQIFAGIITVFIVVVVALFAGGVFNGDNDSTDANDISHDTAQVSEQESLADKVNETYKKGWGIDSYTDFLTSEDYPSGSLVGYISEMEDVSTGTVRVHIQTNATKEEAEQLAKNVLSMTGTDIEELDWVVVRGTDGRDYQASRNDIPALR